MAKTMQIDNKIYNDAWFFSLSPEAKWLFVFLLTNDTCNLIGCYEMPFQIIISYTGLSTKKIDLCFKELKDKIIYKDGWIIIKNFLKYSSNNNPSIEIAKKKQLASLPEKINTLYTGWVQGVKTFYTYNDNDIDNDKDIDIDKDKDKKRVVKGKTLNDLSEEDIEQIAQDYKVPTAFVLSKIDDMKNYCMAKGKVYKDYKAALRNWVKKDAMERKEVINGKSKITVITPDPNWNT